MAAGDHKKLGPFLATMMVASSMIGSGVFLLPASLGAVGSISIVAWLLATLGAAAVAGVFCALAVLDPGKAGLFSYIREAFGPGAGFVAGVLYWATCWIASVAVALAVAGYLSVFIPAVAKPPGLTIATVAIIWLFTLVNAIGPRFVARLQSWTLILGLAPVVLVALGGWFYFHAGTFLASWNVSGQSALAVVPGTTVTVFWAFLGMEAAIVLSARVRNPARNIPIATLGGLGIAAAIYIAACTAIMGILPAAVLAKSSAPFADAVAPILGTIAAGIVALCAMLKASGTLGATILLTLESAECESVQGQMRSGFSAVPADKASMPNLLFTGALMTAVTIASVSPTLARQFAIVTDLAVVLTVIVYGGASLALLRMSSAFLSKSRIWIRALAVAGVAFSAWLVAVSEFDLLICAATATLLAVVAYMSLRFRRLQTARNLSGA